MSSRRQAAYSGDTTYLDLTHGQIHELQVQRLVLVFRLSTGIALLLGALSFLLTAVALLV